MHAQYLLSGGCGRRGKIPLAVEAARPPQRRIDGFDAVGGADDHDSLRALESVHQCEELGDGAEIRLRACRATDGCDGVDLVYEDDRRCLQAGLAKDFSQIFFGLTGVRSDDLWT